MQLVAPVNLVDLEELVEIKELGLPPTPVRLLEGRSVMCPKGKITVWYIVCIPSECVPEL